MSDVEWSAVTPEAFPDLWVVVGETASGKSELALKLAERFGGELVSADSVQVYRHFDLGSGKPTPEELTRAPHHLVDVREPLATLDAATFAELAEQALTDIRSRGRRPILVGGTFLWVKAVVHGLAPGPPADAALRSRHKAIVESEGRQRLHELLREIDPEAAASLAPNDFVRVSRALEVFELTGRPQSAWHREHAFATVRHPHHILRVRRQPGELDPRIAARAEGWLARGWADEVRALVDGGFGDARAMGSVGYREVKAFVDGELREEELLPAIVRATRVFARRQRTWLRDLAVTFVAPDR